MASLSHNELRRFPGYKNSHHKDGIEKKLVKFEKKSNSFRITSLYG